MARITIEDCLERVENRFALVHVASKRSKELFKGSRPIIACSNKEIVTSLREIADGKISATNGESAAPEKITRKKKLAS